MAGPMLAFTDVGLHLVDLAHRVYWIAHCGNSTLTGGNANAEGSAWGLGSIQAFAALLSVIWLTFFFLGCIKKCGRGDENTAGMVKWAAFNAAVFVLCSLGPVAYARWGVVTGAPGIFYGPPGSVLAVDIGMVTSACIELIVRCLGHGREGMFGAH